MNQQQIADCLLQELSDRGQIIEGGWKAYEFLTDLKSASKVQRDECRKAFFFGAQHLFGSVLQMLSPNMDRTGLTDLNMEPTELDLERMRKLDAELALFLKGNPCA